MQRPELLRNTAEVVRKGFKERYKWWATVELGRRMLLLLFIVSFPGNDVSTVVNYRYICCTGILYNIQ